MLLSKSWICSIGEVTLSASSGVAVVGREDVLFLCLCTAGLGSCARFVGRIDQRAQLASERHGCVGGNFLVAFEAFWTLKSIEGGVFVGGGHGVCAGGEKVVGVM